MRAITLRAPAVLRSGEGGELVAGIALLGGLVALGVATALFLPVASRQDLLNSLSPPGENGFFLGSDSLGRNVLAWTGAGILTACKVSASVVALSASLGTTIGLFAGYFRGLTDAVLMRVVDLQLAIPPLIFFIAASVFVGHSLPALVCLLSIFSWVPYARMVRNKVLVERESDFIAAARLAGATRRRLLVVHLLPGNLGLILTFASTQGRLILLWESGLSFLGVGLQPPDISLGFLILQGREEMATAWWVVTFPGLALIGLVVAFNLIGGGLAAAFRVDERLYAR